MNILCYGDSNTYGLTQDWKGRYPRDVRWPGRLQMLLGPEHYVIEDGLVGRCCAIRDTHRYGRAATDFLPVALECHKPLDWLLLAFGTNDCKTVKARSVDEAAAGMDTLIRLAQSLLGPETRIVIMAASPLRAPVLQADPDFDSLAVEISNRLAPEYEKLARKYGCLFFDIGSVARTGDGDGEHLTPDGHRAVAEAVAKLIMEHTERNDTP